MVPVITAQKSKIFPLFEKVIFYSLLLGFSSIACSPLCVLNSWGGQEQIDLMSAISRGDEAAVLEILQTPQKLAKIKFKVDPQEKSVTGNTPLSLAAFKGKPRIVGMILAHASRVGSASSASASASSSSQEEESKGDHSDKITPDDQKMENGATPLMIAAAHGHFDVVKLLLRQGSNPRAVWEYEGAERAKRPTALLLAGQGDHPEIMNLLSNQVDYAQEIKIALAWGNQNLAADYFELFKERNHQEVSAHHAVLKYEKEGKDGTLLDPHSRSMVKIFGEDECGPDCSICTLLAGSTTDKPGKVKGRGKTRLEVVITECGHIYCKSCLKTWLASKPATKPCPTCKKELLQEDRQLFNPRKDPFDLFEGTRAPVPGIDEPDPKKIAEVDHFASDLGFVKQKAGQYISGPDPVAHEDPYDSEAQEYQVIEKDFFASRSNETQREYRRIMGPVKWREHKALIEQWLYKYGEFEGRGGNVFNRAEFIGDDLPIILLNEAEEDEYIQAKQAMLTTEWEKIHPGKKPPKVRRLTEPEWEYLTTVPLAEGVHEEVMFNGQRKQITATHQKYPAGNNENSLPPRREWEEGPYPENSSDDILKVNARGIKGLGGSVGVRTGTQYRDPMNPHGYIGSALATRGGSWVSFARGCRSSARTGLASAKRSGDVGVRLAIEHP